MPAVNGDLLSCARPGRDTNLINLRHHRSRSLVTNAFCTTFLLLLKNVPKWRHVAVLFIIIFMLNLINEKQPLSMTRNIGFAKFRAIHLTAATLELRHTSCLLPRSSSWSLRSDSCLTRNSQNQPHFEKFANFASAPHHNFITTQPMNKGAPFTDEREWFGLADDKVTFKIDDKTIYAHATLLCMHSPVFEAMLKPGMKEGNRQSRYAKGKAHRPRCGVYRL